MKSKIIISILLLISFSSNAQHSKRYLELMENLIAIDFSSKVTYYKHCKIEYSGTATLYNYNDKEYSFVTGKNIRYYRNGSRTEGIYDSWGTILESRYYDKEGNLISESITHLIDSNASNLEEFDKSNMHINFTIRSKDYKYSNELSKWYVYKENEYTNGKKSGIWNYYLPSGELKKQKTYNKQYYIK